jgi:hypothetical protein
LCKPAAAIEPAFPVLEEPAQILQPLISIMLTDQQIRDKAKEMLEELEANRLEVFLIPDCYDETRNSRRVRISENAQWYQEFCAEYPSKRKVRKGKFDTIIRRNATINGLNRVIAGDRKTVYAKRLIEFMGGQ